MVTLTHLIFSGVLERFRDLQVIVLESSGGWIYTWLERLEHHMRRLPSLRPGVKRGALQQFRDHVWVSFDPDEKALPAMVCPLRVGLRLSPLRRDVPGRHGRAAGGDRAALGGEPAADPGGERAPALPYLTDQTRSSTPRAGAPVACAMARA
jgi:hypothetical protein